MSGFGNIDTDHKKAICERCGLTIWIEKGSRAICKWCKEREQRDKNDQQR